MTSLSLTFFTASPRVLSFPLFSSFSSSLNVNLPPPSSLSFRSGAGRFASFKVEEMSKMLQDVESAQKTIFAASAAQDERKKSLSIGEVNHSRAFLDARTEQELLSGISKEVKAGRLPSNLAALMEELYHNYKNAVFSSGKPGADELVLSNMAVTFDRVLLDMEELFQFQPYHKALREPFDYYMLGQNYIRPLIDFSNSYAGNISLFYEMEQKLQQGHNIILISNHQTEADPAIIALLLESANSHIAENLNYVAGDRVLTDPLCKPFSMGRNLICVYSKKHMFDAPELIEMKRKANTRSLKELALLLRGGSQIVWIAPIGERRAVSFCGAGLSVAREISFSDIASAFENPEEAKEAYSRVLYDSVTEQYNVLKSAINGKQGLDASIPSVSLSQPWN
ncbi:glycerol-3-phosphate acyltransferase ATS12, chloroplastic-like isoform X2 [Mangifera indica]|uniref:glycerol-3-phosphate acyltransferase ATS12, chloroplastic-like isoform X2 n=1 Tax=Mangifera indica TaxID=29780 RepID=UPI001CF9E424|nr:glycerol-3-phosphate acyltransferase ATS12, chloroplastic-like isoform X2 [Mangifera indica]